MQIQLAKQQTFLYKVHYQKVCPSGWGIMESFEPLMFISQFQAINPDHPLSSFNFHGQILNVQRSFPNFKSRMIFFLCAWGRVTAMDGFSYLIILVQWTKGPPACFTLSKNHKFSCPFLDSMAKQTFFFLFYIYKTTTTT